MLCCGCRTVAVEDYVGGSSSSGTTEPAYKRSFIPLNILNDVMRGLPALLEVYSDIHTLACCCREFCSIIKSKTYWRDRHIRLDVDELRNNMRALNNAADLFSEAGSLALDVPQLASFVVIPSRSVINWRVREAVVRGNTIKAWTSTHALLGAARFSLVLPSETRALFVGAKAVDADARSFFIVKRPYAATCTVHFAASRLGVMPADSQRFRHALLPAGFSNVFSLCWSSSRLDLNLNGQTVGRARWNTDTAEGPSSFSNFFCWVVSDSTEHQQPDLVPLLAPVVESTPIRRLAV